MRELKISKFKGKFLFTYIFSNKKTIFINRPIFIGIIKEEKQIKMNFSAYAQAPINEMGEEENYA
jgi:ABC-type uncharacterized transport system substrate-binding protein